MCTFDRMGCVCCVVVCTFEMGCVCCDVVCTFDRMGCVCCAVMRSDSALCRFEGSLSYDQDTDDLVMTAYSPEEQSINDYVSLSSLSLVVSVNTNTSEVLGTSIDGQIVVSLGSWDLTTGTVVFTLEGGSVGLDVML